MLVKSVGFMRVIGLQFLTFGAIWLANQEFVGKNRHRTFPPKNIRNPLAPKLLVRLKNQGGCKNGTDILYLLAKFGGDPPLHGGFRKKFTNLQVLRMMWST